jgi:hypothetical protein
VKGLQGTNTLAYYENSEITDKNSFITFAPGGNEGVAERHGDQLEGGQLPAHEAQMQTHARTGEASGIWEVGTYSQRFSFSSFMKRPNKLVCLSLAGLSS